MTVQRSLRVPAKVLLVFATVACGLSVGGAMLVAAPVLVPLHWLAGRDSGGYGAGGWAVLASTSVFEACWMWTYAITDSAVIGLFAGGAAAVVTGIVFLRRAADRFQRRLLAEAGRPAV